MVTVTMSLRGEAVVEGVGEEKEEEEEEEEKAEDEEKEENTRRLVAAIKQISSSETSGSMRGGIGRHRGDIGRRFLDFEFEFE